MNNKFVIKDESNKEIECELLFTFKDTKTNRDFVVFRYKKENNKESISAGIVNTDGETMDITLVSNDDDWDLVDEKLKEKYGDK